MGRGMPFEIFAIVRKLRQLIGLDGVQGVGQRHVAEAVVMAVTFTVRSDMDELGPVALLGERAVEPVGQILTAGEQSFKGDGASDRSVIKKQGNLSPRRQPLFIGLRRIYARAADVAPNLSSDGATRFADAGKNGKTNP